MKAREWAASFKFALENHTYSEWGALYVDETLDLISKRGGTMTALESAVREQEQKFRAICRGTDLSVSFFFDIMEQHAPEVWDMYCKQCMAIEKRKYQKAAHAEYMRDLAKAKAEPNPELRLALMYAAMVNRCLIHEEMKGLYT